MWALSQERHFIIDATLNLAFNNTTNTLELECSVKNDIYTEWGLANIKGDKWNGVQIKAKFKDWDSHHITGTGEVIVEQAFQGHPAHRPILIIPQAVVVHGEEVSSQRVIGDLHLHVVINAVGSTTESHSVSVHMKSITPLAIKVHVLGSNLPRVQTKTHVPDY